MGDGRARAWIVVTTMLVLAVLGVLLQWRARSETVHGTTSAPRASESASRGSSWSRKADDAPPATIDGRVTVSGKALAGAWVTVQDESKPNGPATASVATLEDGSFVFPSIPAGKYRLAATSRGLRPAHSDVLTVESGGAVRGVALTLEPGGVTVSGHVLDSGGGPISHASVTTRDDGLVETLTDDRGAYALTLEPRAYSLVVRATNYAEHSKLLVLVEDATVDFLLHPGATVRGHVVRGDTPVAGASIQLAGDDIFSASSDTTSRDDGSFEFRGLNPGRFELIAHKDADVAESGNLFVDVAGDTDVTLSLGAGAAMTGKILDPDGRSIAGARVQLRRGWTHGRWKATSGEDGTYRIDGALAGTLDVDVEAEGFIDLDTKIELSPRGTTHDYRLDPGASIEGMLVDVDERPVPNAQIDVHAKVHYAAMHFGETDREGRFTLKGLSADDYELRAESKGGFASAQITVANAGKVSAKLKLEKGASIAGRVTLEGGAPAVGSVVVVRGADYATFRGTVRPDGTYAIASVPIGELYAHAEGPSVVPHSWSGFGRHSDARTIRVAAGESKTNVDFVVANALAPIRGIVVQADGTPAPRIAVLSNSLRQECRFPRMRFGGSETDSEGAFILDGASSPIDVCALPPGLPIVTVPKVSAGTTDLRIVLERGKTIAGTVVRDDGKPIGHCVVEAKSASPSGAFEEPTTTTNANGAFEIRGLGAGTYALHARTQDGMYGEIASVVLDTGDKAGLRIVLSAGASLRGQVIDESGAPVREARVEVGAAAGTTNADGSFFLQGLPGGQKTLYVHPSGGVMFDSRDVSLRDGAELDTGVFRVVFRDRDENDGIIGLDPDRVGDRLTVTKVFPNLPAAKAGIREGDVIEAINGFTASELGDHAAPALIRGPVGTVVTLRVSTGQTAARTVTITRAEQPDD